MGNSYLLDTHALLFWVNKASVSEAYINYFDRIDENGLLYVSSVCFWEIAFLVKKGKIKPFNVVEWKNTLLDRCNLTELSPSSSELLESVRLPDYHKDPFDRLIIVQANRNGHTLVTRDEWIQQYEVRTFWL